MPPSIPLLQERLLAWYAQHKRDLPWRRTRDPYAHLVAEVMLQQTGVERVAPKHQEFLERFPDFSSLAAASPGEVIRAWSPLGYNRRALNLHRTARLVMERHGGLLPAESAQLRALPGVGPYTASALACFALGQEAPVVDTNVQRVLGRLFLGPQGPYKRKAIENLAAAALPPGRAADWGQALMDLGAQVCWALGPQCQACPVRELCAAYPALAVERPRRRVAEAALPYLGSRRYYRGRIVEALRRLPPGAALPIQELGPAIKKGYSSEDGPWLAGLLEDLQREGLVARPREELVALPEEGPQAYSKRSSTG